MGIPRCRHGVAALDATLSALLLPESQLAEKLRSTIGLSSWGRTLALLKQVAPPSPAAEPESVRLAWRIDLREGGRGELTLKPVLQRQGRKGWTQGQSVGLEQVASDEGGQFREEDRRAAAFLLANRSRIGGLSLWHALKALVGHPHLSLSSAPQTELRIVEAELGLCCVQTREGGFSLTAGLHGQPVDPGQLHLVSREPPGYVLARPEQGELVLLRCPGAVRQMLEVLAKRGATFPAEAEEALAQELTSLPVNVTLPPKLAGEEQPPRSRPVLVAELEALTLSVETHVRPLAGGLTFPVSAGPVQVRGEVGGKRFFTVRRFDEERKEAASLWERLAPDRAEARAGRFSLTAEGQDAVEWLKRLEQLAADGVEVVFPPRRPRILRPVRGADLRVSVKDARDWFGLAGAAEVDGDRIELAVMLEAARRRQRFVPVGENAWAEVSAELLAKLAPLADLAVTTERGPEVSLGAAPALEALAGDIAELDGGLRMREVMERLRAASGRTPAVPAGLRAELRPYQREGYEWLARLSEWAPGACLADDMGLGKTLQGLALLVERAEKGPALVVAPTSVCFNWEAESARFAPELRVHVWYRCDRDAVMAQLGARDVVVTSYGLLARDEERFKEKTFATLVLDEAQAVKNPAARRSKAAREVNAEFRVALSGTPLENHLGELWSLFRTVFPGLMGSEEQFRQRFQGPIEREKNPERRAALAALLRPFLLRRTKGEVARDLPPKTDVLVPISLTPQERRLYEDARLAAVAQLTDATGPAEQKRFHVLAALTRLRQLACHPKLHDPTWTGPASKLTRVIELIDELRDEGHRVLVFSQFTRHLALVREALKAKSVPFQYLDGETAEAERRKRVEAFQAGLGDVFLISLKAGGTGLNLTGADNVIHLDPWWNPAVEDQATDRAHRIGQTRPVSVYRVMSRGTVEEQILSLHAEKRELLANVLDGTGEAVRFDVEELTALLRLASADSSEASDASEDASDVEAPAGVVEALPEQAPATAGVSAGDPLLIASSFKSWLSRQAEAGLIGKGPVSSYPRAVERFLGFVKRANLGLGPEGVEAPLASYLQAVSTGEYEAPASEPILARAAVRKFGAFLRAERAQ